MDYEDIRISDSFVNYDLFSLLYCALSFNMSKLLTVFGATGLQGGSLLHYLLKRPDVLNIYRLRGITRDLGKPAAMALKEAGVEMLQVICTNALHVHCVDN